MKIIIFLVLILTLSACTGQATKSLGNPVSCSDSDGGKNYAQAGTVIVRYSSNVIETFPDTCEKGSLIENYCDGGNFPRQRSISCDCFYGTCS